MLEHAEKRSLVRHNAECNLIYKFPESDIEYAATCINMSGTGILFKSSDDIELGRALEIRIMPENYICPSITVFIEVTRSDAVQDEQFEIAGAIKCIKAN